MEAGASLVLYSEAITPSPPTAGCLRKIEITWPTLIPFARQVCTRVLSFSTSEMCSVYMGHVECLHLRTAMALLSTSTAVFLEHARQITALKCLPRFT